MDERVRCFDPTLGKQASSGGGPKQQVMMVAVPRNHFDLRRQLVDPPQVMMAALPRNQTKPLKQNEFQRFFVFEVILIRRVW